MISSCFNTNLEIIPVPGIECSKFPGLTEVFHGFSMVFHGFPWPWHVLSGGLLPRRFRWLRTAPRMGGTLGLREETTKQVKRWLNVTEFRHVPHMNIRPLDRIIWVWVNTYRYIFSGMNIHLPAILMFTRGTRFWHTAISWDAFYTCLKKQMNGAIRENTWPLLSSLQFSIFSHRDSPIRWQKKARTGVPFGNQSQH